MSVHKPKFQNIPMEMLDSFIKHHIPYELWMMRDSLAAALRGAPNRFQQNLHVEGFALHARNLMEFLKNGESCGYNPTDFTTNAFSVERKFIRGTLVDMINEQISHLTVDRTQKQEEKFDEPQWRETAEAVENELNRWIKNLKPGSAEKPGWAEKWEQRERMGEAEAGVINLEGHVDGPCTAPVSS